MNSIFRYVVVLVCFTAVLPAYADKGGDHVRRYNEGGADRRHYDREFRTQRLGTPRHFYKPGYRVPQLPARHHHFVHDGLDYFYFGGNFFLRPHDSYEVIRPPYGARVPYLPPGYVSFYLGARHYFYVNLTYYLWDVDHREYVVVREPEGAADEVVNSAERSSSEIYAYPAEGQSAGQQERDYYDCHVWSVDETGYDPTLEGQNVLQFRDYRRAMTACLEGRGYSVK